MNNDIIIVGNGPSILKYNLGAKVDQFNNIVRINDFIIDGYETHVGSKTTIWSTGAGHQTTPRNIYTSGFKEIWISCPSVCINSMAKLANRVTRGGHYTIMGYNVTHSIERDIKLPRNVYCTSGMYAIAFALLRYSVVYMYGFDFFDTCAKGKPVEHYYGVHKTHRVGMDHNVIAEREYINKLIDNGRIKRLENC